MAQHHTIILPSLWPENAPIVLREAAALGLQIICTSGGGQEISKQSIVVDRTIESLRDGIQLVIKKREIVNASHILFKAKYIVILAVIKKSNK